MIMNYNSSNSYYAKLHQYYAVRIFTTDYSENLSLTRIQLLTFLTTPFSFREITAIAYHINRIFKLGKVIHQ